jgi:putative acetyltransferase
MGWRKNMIIRNETARDIEAITEVTKAAFEHHPISHQTEHYIVKALRRAGALTVSLVAEIDGKVVGHIAFSPVAISDGNPNWYGAGPLSVLPKLQKQGIGKALLREGLGLLKAKGAEGCVLAGDPAYYTRFGFRNIPGLILEGVPPENFLARPFTDKTPKGTVTFHEGFMATE